MVASARTVLFTVMRMNKPRLSELVEFPLVLSKPTELRNFNGTQRLSKGRTAAQQNKASTLRRLISHYTPRPLCCPFLPCPHLSAPASLSLLSLSPCSEIPSCFLVSASGQGSGEISHPQGKYVHDPFIPQSFFPPWMLSTKRKSSLK